MSSKEEIQKAVAKVPIFRRSRDGSREIISRIGGGSLGGKASGLAFIKDVLFQNLDMQEFPDFTINIPSLTVIGTDFFDIFMRENNLYDIAYSEDAPDDRIAHAFQKAKLSMELTGDLRSIISQINTPLAIRSSSLLEDAMYEPFAGVYGTKMIPNNQPDIDTRFNMLIEAIKFVYSSVYFREAKAYIKATKKAIESEKMAVIIQEVVGLKHWERFYPHISGVARSYNFYPCGHAQPEDGVIDLALGLGKTIVDGGMAWTYSPSFPKAVPPYNSIGDLLKQTQTKFWAVNMDKPPVYDPIRETEYMVQSDLMVSEKDNTIKYLASTYIPARDRISPGIGPDGPRLINFAPILGDTQIPLNNLIKKVLTVCQEAVGNPVEIEFAVTLDDRKGLPARFGLLQVRPMVVSDAEVEVADEELADGNTLIASKNIMGNGLVDDIEHVVFVKPDVFNAANSQKIAYEIEGINRKLANDGIPVSVDRIRALGQFRSLAGYRSLLEPDFRCQSNCRIDPAQYECRT